MRKVKEGLDARLISSLTKVFIDNKNITNIYDKFILPELLEGFSTMLSKPHVYSHIKRECAKAALGTRLSVYTLHVPPDYVLAMNLKDHLLWEWRWKEALRMQKRKSAWLPIYEEGVNWETYTNFLDIAFEPEVMTEKERRRLTVLKYGRKGIVTTIDTPEFEYEMDSTWQELRLLLSKGALYLQKNPGFLYLITVEIPRARKEYYILAEDIHHLCALIAVHRDKRTIISRLEEKEFIEYKDWLHYIHGEKDVTEEKNSLSGHLVSQKAGPSSFAGRTRDLRGSTEGVGRENVQGVRRNPATSDKLSTAGKEDKELPKGTHKAVDIL